ncbi:MAG TPA: alkane 1-monooxygenase [Rhizomicrobium sp.]|jgi:alkane 1-monooxygenase
MFVYLGPVFALASVPAFYEALGPAGPFLTIALLLFFLIGAEAVSPRGTPPAPRPTPAIYRTLPVIYVPLQLFAIAWATRESATASWLGYVSLLLAIGVTTGVFGMLCAHELVHGKSRAGRVWGALMLTGMSYRHFRIAHLYGHHRYAGTSRDSATARLGEGYYAFLIRTVIGQFGEAWAHERLRTKGRLFANRVLGDIVLTAVLFAGIAALWGWRGVLFFIGQSAVGVIVLELFNYIAHYGLVRRRGEAFDDRHSWNSSNVLANALIFNMGRHSDHHRRPTASYQELSYKNRAPELPAGYAGSILMALLPPLWKRVMDPAVRAVQPA